MFRRQQTATMDQTGQHANGERAAAESDQVDHAARPGRSVLIGLGQRLVQLFDVTLPSPRPTARPSHLAHQSNGGKANRRIEHNQATPFFAALVLVAQ